MHTALKTQKALSKQGLKVGSGSLTVLGKCKARDKKTH
jgi:hypothetical protein